MSKTNHIPLIYHPTNVLMLDDDRTFLESLKPIIDINVPYIVEADPELAFAYLNKHCYRENTLPSLVSEPNFDHIEGLGSVEHFNVDFGKLSEKVDTPDRFNRVTVAFIDQLMPRMNGLDFCRKVKEQGLQVKLVLLTGNAGLDDAISAFNEGVIDAYISKGRLDLVETINFYLARESWQQFVDLGSRVSGLIAHTIQPLNDKKFSEFFHEIWRDHQKGEFYLMDSSCSFMFFDPQGEATLLMVRNEADFAEAIEFAKNAEASETVTHALEARESFPHTKQKSGYVQLDADEWPDALVKVKPILGTDLYYTLINQPDVQGFSFDRYFAEVWPKKAS